MIYYVGSLQLTPIIMVKTGDAAMFAIGFIFIIEASDTLNCHGRLFCIIYNTAID